MPTGNALITDINTCRVESGHAAWWWLGQHGFVVKLGETVCWLDPFISEHRGRQVVPLLRATELTNAAVVLGSHDHADHIDRPAWPGIAAASPQAVFIVPEPVRKKIIAELALPASRVIGLADKQRVTVAGITISAIPAAHELLEPDPATGQHPALGFILEGNDFCLYHAGDTCVYEGMQERLRHRKIDLALLPINGRDAKRLAAGCIGNMTYQEAVDLAGAIRPGLTVPAHFEMFANNCEDPQLFVDYLRVKYPGLKTTVPVHGERMMA